jgi:hypothetical protein
MNVASIRRSVGIVLCFAPAILAAVGCDSSEDSEASDASATSAGAACISNGDRLATTKTYGDDLSLLRVAASCLATNVGAAFGGDGGLGRTMDGSMLEMPDDGGTGGGKPNVNVDEAFVQKVTTCIEDTTLHELSSGCATCYAKFEACVVTTCADCQGDPQGKACVACRCGKNDARRNCVGELEACGGTGLPIDCGAALE